MCNENAEMHYDGTDTADSVLIAAEQQLLRLPNVNGVAITKTADGADAILVYVASSEALKKLPSSINGLKVIGEITGEIRSQ